MHSVCICAGFVMRTWQDECKQLMVCFGATSGCYKQTFLFTSLGLGSVCNIRSIQKPKLTTRQLLVTTLGAAPGRWQGPLYLRRPLGNDAFRAMYRARAASTCSSVFFRANPASALAFTAATGSLPATSIPPQPSIHNGFVTKTRRQGQIIAKFPRSKTRRDMQWKRAQRHRQTMQSLSQCVP